MIDKDNQGVYADKMLTEKEINRLKLFSYPHTVSKTLLERIPTLEGKHVLDIGAGSNTDLANYVHNRNGIYLPADYNEQLLLELRKGLRDNHVPFLGIQTDAQALGLADRVIDIVHQRFVLMHLPREQWGKTITELLRVKRETVFLLEYNWKTLQSSQQPETIKKFKDLSFEFMQIAKMDPFAGDILEDAVYKTTPNTKIKVERFLREEENYTPELIWLCESASSMAEKFGKQEIADKFLSLRSQFFKSPIIFTPAEIVTVTL